MLKLFCANFVSIFYGLQVAWSSGGKLVSINEVALHRARLVRGWVAVLSAGKPSQYITSYPGQLSLAIPHGWAQWSVIDWVNVLRPTRHKIGHFGDVLPSQSLDYYWVNKIKTRRKNQNKATLTGITKFTATQNNHASGTQKYYNSK